jgi:glycosyltransferase involved in cell wall biosynthesis
LAARSIVQVTLWNSPYLGNVMLSQLALAEEVKSQFGFRTHFVLADGALEQPWLTDLDEAGVTWSVLPPKRAGWRAHLERVVHEHAAPLVHTHFTAADLPAASVAYKTGAPCVWHIRTGFNGYPLLQRAKDLLKMRIVARRRVARVVAVSPWLAELAHRRGAPRDRIVVVPNAIVVERFAQLPDRSAARERFGLNAGANVVLGLGWWPEVKGVDVFVDALRLVTKRRSGLQALLVGEEQLRSFLAEKLPTPPPWLRLSGFVSDSAWLFAAADVFVSASRHEGQSSAIGEALACGLPVVMSDIAGSAVWGAAPYALTFPTEDAGALAARLEQVLDDSPSARVAGGKNRQWAQEHAGVDAWCAQLCALYRTLLE